MLQVSDVVRESCLDGWMGISPVLFMNVSFFAHAIGSCKAAPRSHPAPRLEARGCGVLKTKQPV